MEDEIRQKIEILAKNGDFVTNLINQVNGISPENLEDYFGKIASEASYFRNQLLQNGLLKKIDYAPAAFWPSVKGEAFSFVDGGTATLNLPHAIPIAIRAGAYTVTCGTDTSDREKFDFPEVMIDEVYSPSGLGMESYDDVAKVCDGARILLELAAVFKISEELPKKKMVMLHGPLINPIGPYGIKEFPKITESKYQNIFQKKPDDENDLDFLIAYRKLSELIFASETPMAGVVERDMGSLLVANHFLDYLNLGAGETNRRKNGLKSYGLSDVRLFSCVLNEGEYIGPFEIDKQGTLSRVDEYYRNDFAKIKKPFIYFLSNTTNSKPIRCELNPSGVAKEFDSISSIFHIARLLPSYLFPAGLQVVDQFAKIPNWLQSRVKAAHGSRLVFEAINSGNPEALSLVKKILLSRGRDWFLRPTHEK
jgi:hypothetical protein